MTPPVRALQRLTNAVREWRRSPTRTNENHLNNALAQASRVIDIALGQPLLFEIEETTSAEIHKTTRRTSGE